MSMEINGSRYDYGTDCAEQMKAKQTTQGILKAREICRDANDSTVPDKAPDPQDEYISSEKSGGKSSGLYRVEQDENGRRKIIYEDPNRTDRADRKKQPQASGDNPENPEEKCIGNTDRIEREIRKLKEEEKRLERQLQSASGDESEIRELEKKLALVKNELSLKDNDTYRRQNTSFSQ